MATARLDMRLDETIKAKAEKATTFLGIKSLTEYVVKLVDEDASRVIAEHESITVENDAFDRFWAACNRARKPNKALTNAAEMVKEQGFK